MTQAFLMLFVASLAGLIMANEIPGTWWQWVLLSVLTLFAAATANYNEGDGDE